MASTDKTQRIAHWECTKNQKREYISIWKIQTHTCGPLKKSPSWYLEKDSAHNISFVTESFLVIPKAATGGVP